MSLNHTCLAGNYIKLLTNQTIAMTTSLGRVIILVDDYDNAFSFYQQNFGCEKLFDATLPDGQRYLHVRFNADDKTGIWFLKADRVSRHHWWAGKQAVSQRWLYTPIIAKSYMHRYKPMVLQLWSHW